MSLVWGLMIMLLLMVLIAVCAYLLLLPYIVTHRINKVRAVLGREELMRLPRGQRGAAGIGCCPVARAFGAAVDADYVGITFLRDLSLAQIVAIEKAWGKPFKGYRLRNHLAVIMFMWLFDSSVLYRGYRESRRRELYQTGRVF